MAVRTNIGLGGLDKWGLTRKGLELQNLANQYADQADALHQRGNGLFDASINSAQQGVNFAVGAYNAVQPYLGKSYDLLSKAGDTTELRKSAANVRGLTQGIADTGNTITNQGAQMYGLGSDILGLNLNSDSPLVANYVRYINSLDPNARVAQAASDVQASYANALGQAERDLARRGVSATSGAAGALRRNYMQALAAAQAGAKTNQRAAGKEAQGAALKEALSAAMGAQKTGTELQATGANTVANAGTNEAKAGDLFAAAARIETTVSGNMAELIKTNMGAAQAAVNAYNYLTKAQQDAAREANARGNDSEGVAASLQGTYLG